MRAELPPELEPGQRGRMRPREVLDGGDEDVLGPLPGREADPLEQRADVRPAVRDAVGDGCGQSAVGMDRYDPPTTQHCEAAAGEGLGRRILAGPEHEPADLSGIAVTLPTSGWAP